MKAIIFKELPKEFLKPEFREGKPDIVRFYRTDSFGSTSSDIMNSKMYSYEIKDNNIIINGNNIEFETYENIYIQPHISLIKSLIKDNDIEYLELIKVCRIGYVIVNDDQYKNLHSENLPFDYTHEVILDDEYNYTINRLTRKVKRERTINELLKNV